MADKEELQEAIARIQMRVDEAKDRVLSDEDEETAGVLSLVLSFKFSD